MTPDPPPSGGSPDNPAGPARPEGVPPHARARVGTHPGQVRRPLSDGEWLERTFASVSLLLAGALFWGYSGAHGWPVWCALLGILALGNGAIFTPLALLSWRDDHRFRRQWHTQKRASNSARDP